VHTVNYEAGLAGKTAIHLCESCSYA